MSEFNSKDDTTGVVNEVDLDGCDECESLSEDEYEQSRENGKWFQVMNDLVRMDKISSDEDIDVLREDVDLRIERMSEDSVFLAGYSDEVNYKYHFVCTDEGLEIRREIIRKDEP